MYLGLIPPTIPPITQVCVIDFWVGMLLIIPFTKVFMGMIEVDIGVITSTFLPIDVVENTVHHQGPLKMLFLGVGEKK